jgi:hypothetical protein
MRRTDARGQLYLGVNQRRQLLVALVRQIEFCCDVDKFRLGVPTCARLELKTPTRSVDHRSTLRPLPLPIPRRTITLRIQAGGRPADLAKMENRVPPWATELTPIGVQGSQLLVGQ